MPRNSGSALREVEEQYEIQHDRRRQNRIAAQEIDLDLHRIAEPSEDVDIVPTLFVITTRRVIVNANLMKDICRTSLGIQLGLQDVVEYAQLRFFLGLERSRIVEHFAVAVAENVGRVPAAHAQQCAP